MATEIDGIAFHELAVPSELLRDHRRKGGAGLRRWTARASDGKVIRVMHGLEPAGKRNQMIRHTSVSVARTYDPGESPCRQPTAVEFEAAVTLTFGSDPCDEFPDPPETPVRHAWDREA